MAALWHFKGEENMKHEPIANSLLVGGDWNMTGLFFHMFPSILGIIIPIDELIFFRVFETTNQPRKSLTTWLLGTN